MIGQFFRKGGWAAVIFVVASAVLAALWYNDRATARALADHGLDATATVVDKQVVTRDHVNDDETETDYYITYAYDAVTADGTTVPQRVEHGTTETDYAAHSSGDQVPIRYLPESPTQADFFPGENARSAVVLGWFSVGALVMAVPLALLALRGARRALRLHATGTRTTGTVDKVQRSESYTVLTVRFRDATGTEHRARAHALSGDQWGGIKAGDAVPLLYDPADPRNVAVDQGAALAAVPAAA